MTRILHITNGDGAANIIKTCVPGDALPWRDPMHHGPFPAALDLEATSKIRADYLAGDQINNAEVARGFALRDAHLKGSSDYEEVILWFEHDLLDQLQILQILDWFSTAHPVDTSLSMICIDRFDGVESFRGIGDLSQAQMASLQNTGQPVTDRQLSLAQKVWHDFRAPDTTSIESFVQSDDDTLPFLRPALRRHFEEYPWRCDGLTRTERQLLTLIADGESRPNRLFLENMNHETVLFIGDWPTYTHIKYLSSTSSPLITCQSGAKFRHPHETTISPEDFHAQRLSLTQLGERVLAGSVHADEVLKRDFWLGGVHLQSGKSLRHWDDVLERLTD